jgi:putative nucleotidyltransferase with HDIG domain
MNKDLISKAEALKLIMGSSKYSHSLFTSAIMGKLAERLGEDEKKWELVGLLHDLDYDLVKDDMSKHGILASNTLKGKLSEDCLFAIKRHDHRTGFKPQSKLDKAIIIADSLVNLIEGIEKNVNIKWIEKEIKKVCIKKPWLKENLLRCEEIGISKSDLLRISKENLNSNSS